MILVACEESQTLTTQLRYNGIEAFSCDIEPCSGCHPEWHLQQDVLPLLKENWKAIIAFPPCTHLAVSGARYFKEKKEDGSQAKAIEFFMSFTFIKCKKICIENPIGIMSTLYKKPDQIIQPWHFGHGETKATCLWLKGLPKLIPSKIAIFREENIIKMGSLDSKKRSKTYSGIAKAMVNQWYKLLK
jgi:hypothetical protein